MRTRGTALGSIRGRGTVPEPRPFPYRPRRGKLSAMTRALFPGSDARKPVIGMVHLKALAGSPGYGGDPAAVLEAALGDAQALAAGGVDAVMLENFWDVPFYPASVPAATVAQVTAVALELRRRLDLPLGVNVLRNDGLAALAAAHAAGADFIRVNVLIAARLTDQGIVHGIAHDLLRERRSLGAERIRILADVRVKHSAPLGDYPLAEEVEDTLLRGGADAVVVSGTGTGKGTDPEEVRRVKAAAGEAPVLVGSGVTAATVSEFREAADGFIVGTALKRDGRVDRPVDPDRVRALLAALRG